jgi:predicted O-linked N-acetylglucosamine transferase (SPINDLY family)
MPSLTPKQHLEAGRRFALSRWGRELGAQASADPGDLVSTEKLKIGYLSADFHDHATMHLLAGVLERHDRSRFEIHLYSYGPRRSDAYVERIDAMPVTFHEVSRLTDRQIADAIARDHVQMLVDLKGYTTAARLGISALRPAPVTISWLGYPGTLGHPGLADFIIGDAVVTPPDCADDFSETLALMPHSYQPNDAPEDIGAPPSRADAGLPERAFVFCSFNQTLKITARSFSLWLHLLHAVPGSVLWLLKPSDDEAIHNLQKIVEASGLDLARLVWAPRLPRRQHLARLQLADLALDTCPYGSHTTGSDALMAGVPMIARSGNLFVSRVSESLLNAIGLKELVATTDETYLQLALSLARDPLRLGQIRHVLSTQRTVSPLFDPRRFARDLERLYEAIWQRASGDERHSRLPIVIGNP